LVFVGAGVWISREWHKLQKPKLQASPEAITIGVKHAQEKFGLSRAEMEVLEMLVQGLTNLEIANARHVSPNTIKTHLSNIYQKMGVARRAQVLAMLHKL
jgi:DNA-binding CsgD family transcriptional regulator